MSTVTTAKNASTATFITALVTNVVVFAIEIIVFTILRRQFKVIYSPRTFIPIASKRSEPLTDKLLGWPMAVYNADYDDIRRQNGLDAYVFVRFLRMMAYILFPMWIISWAVLLPVNAAGKTNGEIGLDRFTFGNVGKANQPRFAAHLVLAWLFTFWILYVVKKEMRHFITVRQRHLVDANHTTTAQARTILVTGVPRRYLQASAIRSVFAPIPGGIQKVWINRDLKDIPDLFSERLAALNKLESAETSLINTATKLHIKRQKKVAKGKLSAEDADKPANDPKADVANSADPEKPLSLADRLVPRGDRPSHRLKPFSWLPFGLPFMGQKVDTIEWAREQIARLNTELATRQEAVAAEAATDTLTNTEEYPPMNSAFVLFNEQIGAHIAASTLTHHEPYRMADKFTEVTSEDIIWSNLNLNPYEMKIRTAISYAATAGLIILWAFPVAFVGAVSNISALCIKYTWLAWICKLPSVVVGIISGVLPPVALAVLMMLLPIVLRLLAQFEGIPRRTGVELSLMTRFFIFQVIHSFLIVTLSSGLIKALPGLSKNPGSAPSLLASNLPGASTFFLTYILLQGLSGAAGGLLQIVPLIIYYVKLYLLGSTPRSVYGIKNTMRSVAWGTQFPNITLLMVITISYSVISPIINGLACAAFFLLYQVWKYLFLYQLDQKPSTDTGGLFFPKAITHVFVGLYVEQLCLTALFFLAQDDRGKPSAIGEGALMIVLIVITAGFHLVINDSYGPLLHSLPLSLVDKSTGGKESIMNSPRQSGDDESDPLKAQATASTTGRSSESPTRSATKRKPVPTVTPKGEHHEMDEIQSNRSDLGDDEEDTSSPVDRKIKDEDGEQVKGTAKGYEAPTDFHHPALSGARTVWIPRDTLGLGEAEERDIRAAYVDVSSEHAIMDAKGHVDVNYYPPGEKPVEA